MKRSQELTVQDLEKALDDRFREIGMLTKYLVETEAALSAEREKHAISKEALEEALSGYQEMLESTSWKLTSPLRRVVTAFRG